jgi:hypothetical protein
MQEFFMENAWEDQVVGVRDALKNMCIRRYGEYALQMQRVWEEALPIIQLMHWTMRADPDGNTEYYFFTYIVGICLGYSKGRLRKNLPTEWIWNRRRLL